LANDLSAERRPPARHEGENEHQRAGPEAGAPGARVQLRPGRARSPILINVPSGHPIELTFQNIFTQATALREVRGLPRGAVYAVKTVSVVISPFVSIRGIRVKAFCVLCVLLRLKQLFFSVACLGCPVVGHRHNGLSKV
jgi:hypothetical protein